MAEYIYLFFFICGFTLLIIFIDSFKLYTAIAFVSGCATSLLSGFVGMFIATRANVRVTYRAATIKDNKESLKAAFNVAFQGGCVMGFVLVSLALAVLTFLILIFLLFWRPKTTDDFTQMFDFIAGYGLGGSAVALFCRVGGGIYTKAADVGADLVGKNEFGLEEDSPDNPATIADNVGDNVGDIAGMGADLFGSFAEATCAALVVSGTSVEMVTAANYTFPLILSASGILVCIITSFFATHIMTVTEKEKIESTLKWQLLISTIILIPTIVLLSLLLLPKNINFVAGEGTSIKTYKSTNTGIMICALIGLISGLIIGMFTDYFTSNSHTPVQNLAKACKSGAAINIIHGLALGYMSCVVPIICLASNKYYNFSYNCCIFCIS